MTQEEQWLLEEKYQGVESKAFHADLERLRAGEPLAYLIGSIPFVNCTIFLDSHPLIPRTETEFWVEKAIAEMKRIGPTPPRVLDLCAGSGAIGIAVAKAVLGTQIDFVEIDPSHISTIKKNITCNITEYSNRLEYSVVSGNLFSNIKNTYDFILTNPPYIDPVLDRAEKSVKENEPDIALYGGKNGMAVIEKIIDEAPSHLTTNGQLWIEHEPEQTVEITLLAEKNGFTCTTHKDQYAVERYSVLVLQ